MPSTLSPYSDDCSVFEKDVDICLESSSPEFIPEDTTHTTKSIPEDKSTVFGTFQDIADYMREDYWTGTSRNWRRWPLNTKSGQITVNIEGSSNWHGTGISDSDGIAPSRRPVFREAFKIYEELLGINFVETTSNNADIFFTDNSSGAGSSSWTSGNTIVKSKINVASSWSGGSSTVAGTYLLQTIVHEIGHSMGLGHPGPYNGSGMTFSANSAYANDCWDSTIMSYWDQMENPNTTATKSYIPTLMTADVIALDDLYSGWGYGISNSFTGDTTYGFNTNISTLVSEAWGDMTDYLDTSSYTITDASGTDTIDLSGFSTSQQLDLRAASKTSTALIPSTVGDGGETQNLFIAPGTIIENAVGGTGNDVISGNSAGNIIKGNTGNDTLKGRLGNDTIFGGPGNDEIDGGLLGNDIVVLNGLLSDYRFTGSPRLGYTVVDLRDAHNGPTDGTDTLVDIESVLFEESGQEVPITQLVNGGYTSIESKGSVELQKDSAGKIYAKATGGSSDDITVRGQHVGVNTYTGWSPVAAETINGQNKVIWTSSAGSMVEWDLDSNWSWSQNNLHAAGSAGFLGVETAFQMDFNNDGVIGAAYTTIESQGSVELQKDSAGKIYAKATGGSSDDITAGGQHVGVNTYTRWSPVAAETINGQNKVIWTSSAGSMVEWDLDSNWSWSQNNLHAAGSAGFLGVETAFQMDFNNDGVIG